MARSIVNAAIPTKVFEHAQSLGLDVYDTARLFTVRLDERRYASRKRATYPRARPPGDP